MLPHYDITVRPTPRCPFSVNEWDAQEHKGKLQSWLRSIIGLTTSHLQSSGSCWRNTEDYTEGCRGSSPIERCSGSHCTTLYAFLSLPVILLVEIQDPDAWDIPEKITLLPKNKDHPTISYQLTSRVFSGNNHFISRNARPSTGRQGRQVFAYDDMEHGGTSVLLPQSKASTHLAGQDITLKTAVPAGFRTYVVVYHLVGGRVSQEKLYHHQLSTLQKHHPMVRISSTTLDDIALSTLSLEGDNLQVVPEAERLWYSPSSPNKMKNKIDYCTVLPTAEPLGTRSRTRNTRLPRTSTPSSDYSGSSYVTVHTSSVLSEDASQSSSQNAEGVTTQTLTICQASPHPVQCRCGCQGDGNLMVDGLDTVQCATCGKYSHIACQRRGRANHIPSGQDFECSECLGEDNGLPGSLER